MKLPTIKEMITAGVHFGHKKNKANPFAIKQYVFGIRDGIYIIDLDQTRVMFGKVLDYIGELVKNGKTILFVGTKRQAKDIVKKVAEDAGMPYMNNRWLGGMLTNFETVRLSIKKLSSFEAKKKTEEYEKMTKQEKARFNKNLDKLEADLGGIRDLSSLPDALLIVDTVDEHVAVAEARKKNIPIIGICDVNANPKIVDYCVPANTGSKLTIEMILKLIGEKIKETKK